MSKQQNQTIGTIINNDHHELDAVRREKNGKLYHVGRYGQHFMRPQEAQEFMLENSHIWGGAGPPADTPEWIVKNLSCPPAAPAAVSVPPVVEVVVPGAAAPTLSAVTIDGPPRPLPTTAADDDQVIDDDPPLDPPADLDDNGYVFDPWALD